MVPNCVSSFSLAPLSCYPNSIKIHAAYRYGEAEANIRRMASHNFYAESHQLHT